MYESHAIVRVVIASRLVASLNRRRVNDAVMQSLVGVASAAGRAAVHAVRVQIIPAPRSLVDSREILRILQSYGEVTTYRWLKVRQFSGVYGRNKANVNRSLSMTLSPLRRIAAWPSSRAVMP